MKCINRILPLLLIVTVLSCGKKESSESQETANVEPTEQAAPEMKAVKIDARKIGPEKSTEQEQIDLAIDRLNVNKENPLVGYWVGAFGRNKINIAIAEVGDGKATGYTVCAGNFRPLNGKAQMMEDSSYVFDMNEPGTDQYDGHFEFKIQNGSMTGKWSPFKKGATSAKEFSLTKTPL